MTPPLLTANKMDIIHWYAISLAAIVSSLIIGNICVFFVSIIRAYGLFYLQKYIFYLVLFKRRNGSGSITRFQALSIITYMAANGILMSIGIRSMSDLQHRAGALATVNIMPLFLGGRMSILLDYVGMSLHSYHMMHHWVGRTFVEQCFLHAVLAIYSSTKWEYNKSQISGIIVRYFSNEIMSISLHFYRQPLRSLLLLCLLSFSSEDDSMNFFTSFTYS